MAQLDQNDNDLDQLNDEYLDNDLNQLNDDLEENEEDNIDVPYKVPAIKVPEYVQMTKDAQDTDSEYLLFIRDDTKGPLNPITIDFMYKIVSINKIYENNTIIEMKDFTGTNQKQQINVRVYQTTDPDVVNEVIENPYIIRKPVHNWIHLMFRYDADTHTWSAWYNNVLWFTRKDDPNFSPDRVNYIKVYTKIPYPKGGDYEAYIANLTITRNNKEVKYYPPYPRDYGPIFVGGPVKIIHKIPKDKRKNIISDPNNILWWPPRSPLHTWETEHYSGFGKPYVYHSFGYGGRYIGQHSNFPPPLYGGYWTHIPAIGPGHATHNGIATFRRGGSSGGGISRHQNITIESWIYIHHTHHNGGWANVYNFVGGHGTVRLCFNGIYFRVYWGDKYWDVPKGNHINQWVHIAFSYVMETQTLYIFINGIIVVTITLIIFIPVDIILYTQCLTAGMQFYHIGLRSTIITKYTKPFDTILAICPPYTVFPGDPGYPIYYPTLPTSTSIGPVFRYPISLNENEYESNGTYFLNENKVELTATNSIDNTQYIHPVITNTTKNITMETNFIDAVQYRVPQTYTLEFWIYVTEPYERPTKINIDYMPYDYITLLIGTNGVYLGMHKIDDENMKLEKAFNLDLSGKWNHIAITCEYNNRFTLFINGKKMYNQVVPNEFFNIYHLYTNLTKMTENSGENNISGLSMYPYIKYRLDFEYKHVRSKPDGIEI